MTEMFSDEWLAAAEAALVGLGPDSGPSLVLAYVISGAPGGKVSVLVTIENGSVAAVASGKPTDADCTITLKFSDAVAILRGETTAEAAFMTGQLKIEGAYEQWLLGLQDLRRDSELTAVLAELAG